MLAPQINSFTFLTTPLNVRCRYCTLLQATMPHVPNVMPIEPRELLEFCCDAGYNCRLEPRGSWFTPPDYNVGMTDWERSLRLRCGAAANTALREFSVLQLCQ